MTRFDIDWPYMRTALIVLAVALLLSTGPLIASFLYATNAEREYAAETINRNTLRSKLRTIQNDRILIDRYLEPYLQLEQSGMVGDEQRINWIDTLQAAAKRMKLPSMRYRIAAQEQFVATYTENASGLVVNASRMELNLGLLHEGDLPHLLSELSQNVPDTFHVKRCNIQRARGQFKYTPKQANLNANCQLLWFTIQPPTEVVEMVEDPI